MPPAASGPRPRRHATAVALLAAVTVLTGACAGDRTARGDGAADAAVEREGALDFRATTLAGPELDVSTLQGQPVVLWFWAPWCTICRVEAPDVAAVASELRGEVTFLGVPGRGETADMTAFVQDTGTEGLRHLVDTDGRLWQRFRVVHQPSFAFVRGDGSVETFAGALGADQLRTRASALTSG